MKATRTRLVLGLLLGTLACGGDSNDTMTRGGDPVASSRATALDTGESYGSNLEGVDTPTIRAVRLSPASPVSLGTIRARIEFAKPQQRRDNAHYTWTVAGEIIEETGAGIELPELRRGDVVSVEVVVSNAAGSSNPVVAEGTVANRPPRIRSLDIAVAQHPEEGEIWVAHAEGDDPDGDELEYRYIWLINGAASTLQDPSFPTRLLKGGDQVRVRVIASDGTSESNPAESGTVAIANAAPEIISTPPPLDAAGRFRYRVEARDSDGDAGFDYELVEGPRGMQMNAETGLLAWTPDADQEGAHRIEIAVSDSGGGRSTQAFVLPIVIESVDRRSVPARHQ